jgi:hypothetical protein
VLAQQTNKNQLDEKTLNRLSELMEEVSGDYIKLQDGEQVVLSFDLNSQATGARTRTIRVKDEDEKQITRLNFMVKTKSGKEKFFEPSNRWAKRCLETIRSCNTTTLIVKRKGSSIFDTTYDFFPVEPST